MQRAAWVVRKNNLCMWNEFQAGGREERRREHYSASAAMFLVLVC